MKYQKTGKKARTANKVLPQWGLTCFYETFVLKQTEVLLLNFGTKNPPLRQYPNRYRQAWKNALKSQKRFSL